MRSGIALRSVLTSSACLMIVTFLMAFAPESWSSGRDINGWGLIFVWAPLLIIFCGSLWVYLTFLTSEGREAAFFKLAAVLIAINVVWVFATVFLSDSLDSMNLDHSWEQGGYFGWIGMSLLAIDATVTIWCVFRNKGLIGSGPRAYLAAAAALFFLSTPFVFSFFPFDELLWLSFKNGTSVSLFSIIMSTAIVAGILWGMLFDSWALGRDEETPSVLSVVVTNVFVLGVMPVVLTVWYLLMTGFGDVSMA